MHENSPETWDPLTTALKTAFLILSKAFCVICVTTWLRKLVHVFVKHCLKLQDMIVFMSVEIQVEFWVLMPCNVVTGYQCFRGSCVLHLQSEASTSASSC
jgi:hypothetical protein